MPGRDADGLTPKQRRFVGEYLKDCNASAAARRAGYSVKTAGWIGQQLLTKTHVSAAIAAGQEELDKFAGLTRKRIIDGLLAETEREGDGCTQAARVAAWGNLARIRGMFVDKHEVTGAGGGPLKLSW